MEGFVEGELPKAYGTIRFRSKDHYHSLYDPYRTIAQIIHPETLAE